jgi:heme exporter protein A
MVSHQTLFYDDLSLLENLSFAAALQGVAEPRSAAERALADAGLAARSGDSPRSLSRGLAQRATIARALLHQPSVLLLDEPFSGLDHEAAARLGATVREGADRGRATLLVTHQLRDAWSLASRAILLREGRLIADRDATGDPDAFLSGAAPTHG